MLIGDPFYKCLECFVTNWSVEFFFFSLFIPAVFCNNICESIIHETDVPMPGLRRLIRSETERKMINKIGVSRDNGKQKQWRRCYGHITTTSWSRNRSRCRALQKWTVWSGTRQVFRFYFVHLLEPATTPIDIAQPTDWECSCCSLTEKTTSAYGCICQKIRASYTLAPIFVVL